MAFTVAKVNYAFWFFVSSFLFLLTNVAIIILTLFLRRSRQIGGKRFRMTRQKKAMFLIVLVFMSLLTLIIVFSRLGSMSAEYDPALDPMNNPMIKVQK